MKREEIAKLAKTALVVLHRNEMASSSELVENLGKALELAVIETNQDGLDFEALDIFRNIARQMGAREEIVSDDSFLLDWVLVQGLKLIHWKSFLALSPEFTDMGKRLCMAIRDHTLLSGAR